MKYISLFFFLNKINFFFFNKIIKKNYIYYEQYEIFSINNFLLIFLKNGYKEKIFKWINFICNLLYKLIYFKYVNCIYSNELIFNLSINNFHFNFNFLLSWVFEIINFCFFYSITNIQNIFKKKQKIQISYKLHFFKKNFKHKLLVKFFFFKSLSLNFNFFKIKLYFMLVDFILNYKNSWIYLFKVFFYKKLFKL